MILFRIRSKSCFGESIRTTGYTTGMFTDQQSKKLCDFVQLRVGVIKTPDSVKFFSQANESFVVPFVCRSLKIRCSVQFDVEKC